MSANKPHIVTSYWSKPIPDRRFDWCAHLEDEEELGGYGYGRTEAEAIESFKVILEEREEQ